MSFTVLNIDPSISDREILRAIAELEADQSLSWLHDLQMDPRTERLVIRAEDITCEDAARSFEISPETIRNAFEQLTQDPRIELCCQDEIADGGPGWGCLDDVNALLQTACYGRVFFA